MKRPESHTRRLRLVCVTENALCVAVQYIFSTLAHKPNRIRPLSPRPHVQADNHPTNTCAPENNGTLTRLSIVRQDRIGAGGPYWGSGPPPQERSPHQRARDQHIRAAGDQKFRREQRDTPGGVGQARRAEHSHHTEQLTHQEHFSTFLSDDDEYDSNSSDGSPISLQRQGGSGNDRRS